VATYAEQSAQLGAQIISHIMEILTPDQKTTIQNLREEIDQNIDAPIDARFACWDDWIVKHSQ
jgi:hypothetical protein